MKTKLVLWAVKTVAATETTEPQEQKVLVALELLPQENKVKTWIIEGEVATQELSKTLMDTWRKGEAVAFPETTTVSEQELSASGALLPESLQAENQDILKRSQTEWLFIVLSNKLYQSYLGELDDLHGKIEKLEAYNKGLWDALKGFWDKVEGQIREGNIFRDHTEHLRERANELFTMLKQLRAAEDSVFEREGRKNYDSMLARIVSVEESLAKSSETFKLFETLKAIQNDFKTLKVSRNLRTELWDRMDEAFKAVKEKRNPSSGNNSNNKEKDNNDERLARRVDGLRDALSKMQNSVDRDKSDLDFLSQRPSNSFGNSQLESQLREVRAKLIQERIDSKQVKLDDMLKTLKELETRLQKNAARAEKADKKAAKQADKQDEQSETEVVTVEATAEAEATAEVVAEIEAATTTETPAAEIEAEEKTNDDITNI
jgi:hypothetical protein